jgi:hypothetical protein
MEAVTSSESLSIFQIRPINVIEIANPNKYRRDEKRECCRAFSSLIMEAVVQPAAVSIYARSHWWKILRWIND